MNTRLPLRQRLAGRGWLPLAGAAVVVPAVTVFVFVAFLRAGGGQSDSGLTWPTVLGGLLEVAGIALLFSGLHLLPTRPETVRRRQGASGGP